MNPSGVARLNEPRCVRCPNVSAQDANAVTGELYTRHPRSLCSKNRVPPGLAGGSQTTVASRRHPQVSWNPRRTIYPVRLAADYPAGARHERAQDGFALSLPCLLAGVGNSRLMGDGRLTGESR